MIVGEAKEGPCEWGRPRLTGGYRGGGPVAEGQGPVGGYHSYRGGLLAGGLAGKGGIGAPEAADPFILCPGPVTEGPEGHGFEVQRDNLQAIVLPAVGSGLYNLAECSLCHYPNLPILPLCGGGLGDPAYLSPRCPYYTRIIRAKGVCVSIR